ncbi:hypothetical protein KY319_02880 [Candidatus Woesearchaeota archaeon]|nr:hypothetical protein [Candidatus Woesearchaeota archaeon]
MKGGSKTIFIWLVLGIIVIAILAIFVSQRKEATEKSVFTNIADKFLPSKKETAIPGTVAGGCPIIELNGAEMLAQAMLDCWCMGQGCGSDPGLKKEIPCCYNVTTKKLTQPITEQEVRNELKRKGTTGKYIATASARGATWNIGILNPGDSNVIICYDNDWYNEVYATRKATATNCK